MRFSFFMALMTLVLSFALLGQVEAKSRRLNKRRLSLERRAGPNNTGVANGNTLAPTAPINNAMANVGTTFGSVNTAITQSTGILGAAGAVGNAAGGLNTVTGTVPGTTPPG